MKRMTSIPVSKRSEETSEASDEKKDESKRIATPMTMREAGQKIIREMFPDVVGVMIDRAAEFAVDFMSVRDEELQARRLSQRWFYPEVGYDARSWEEVERAVYTDGHVFSQQLPANIRASVLAAGRNEKWFENMQR